MRAHFLYVRYYVGAVFNNASFQENEPPDKM